MILNAPGFNIGNAMECAIASSDAYDRATISNAKTDTQVLIVDRGTYISVAFRGTSDLRDIITDADALMTGFGDHDGACVHRGFMEAYESVRMDVLNAIQQLQSGLNHEPMSILRGIKPVVVTGHSLGGALAILCAFDLRSTGLSVDSVYTFGQPRVGNAVFAWLYKMLLGSVTFRVTNGADIVPWSPGWLLGYRHSGVEMFMPTSGGLFTSPGLLSLLTANGLEIYREWKRGRLAALADHHMCAYVSSVSIRNIINNTLTTA
jgi:pimeloyl-ACP methyl ester carboxylesterase